MANLAPALLLGVGVALLVGGKKKKKPAPSQAPADGPESGFEPDPEPEPQPESDTGAGAEETERTPTTVAKGIRKDRRGHHPWRIVSDIDGYRAQLMSGADKFARMQEEIGVAASENAARTLLRDTFNERLLEMYPGESAENDPSIVVEGAFARSS